MLTIHAIRAAELHRQELLAEVARDRLVASACPARAPRRRRPMLAFFTRPVHSAVAALASVAFGTQLN
jgi:hypothetical protein